MIVTTALWPGGVSVPVVRTGSPNGPAGGQASVIVDGLAAGATRLNVAVTLASAESVTVHPGLVPVQRPLQLVNAEP